MTDALSDWFIEAVNEDRKELLGLRTHDDFANFVDKKRQQMSLKDDDTTMVVLKLIPDSSNEISFSKTGIDNIKDFILQEESKKSIDFIGSRIEEIQNVYYESTIKVRTNYFEEILGYLKEIIKSTNNLLKHGTSN